MLACAVIVAVLPTRHASLWMLRTVIWLGQGWNYSLAGMPRTNNIRFKGRKYTGEYQVVRLIHKKSFVTSFEYSASGQFSSPPPSLNASTRPSLNAIFFQSIYTWVSLWYRRKHPAIRSMKSPRNFEIKSQLLLKTLKWTLVRYWIVNILIILFRTPSRLTWKLSRAPYRSSLSNHSIQNTTGSKNVNA